LHKYYRLIYISFLVSLYGCNSSNSTSENEQPVKVEEPVENNVVSLQDISCSGIARLNFIEAAATSEMSGYVAKNVIDSQFISTSRWSSIDNNSSLILTLDDIALLKGLSFTWYSNDEQSYNYDVEVSKDNKTWTPVLSAQSSDALSTRSQFLTIPEHSVNYIKVIAQGNNVANANLVEVEAFGCQSDISSTIKLNDWYLSIPVDEKTNTKAESIYEVVLNDNYFNAEYFFASTDNGLVFRSPIEGAKTSNNTSYTRTELREMLRSGNTNVNVQGVNKNNWVFSSAPVSDQNAAGGIDGELVAELAVNYVTETGDDAQVGRVIIGQIHANDDEPIRVYYRKLPNNNKGSIYLAHEIKGGEDIYYELLGTRSKSAVNPENGIKLNERFGYRISVVGHLLTFTLIREGYDDIYQEIDMSESGYGTGGQYMYFKAGVYNQNNTGDPKDYVQATFYTLENSHSGYIDN